MRNKQITSSADTTSIFLLNQLLLMRIPIDQQIANLAQYRPTDNSVGIKFFQTIILFL